jgi:phosphoglycolate phosphatase-like HAD superfamily hydrolase
MRKNGLLAKDIAMYIKQQNKKSFSIPKFLKIRTNFLESEDSLKYLKPRNYTKSLLAYLQDKNVNCFLCSVRKNKKLLLNFLKINHLAEFFSAVYLQNDITLNIDNTLSENRMLIKNSLLHKIVKENYSRNEVIFVGNSNEDLQCAKAMNITYIHFQNPYLKKLSGKRMFQVTSMKILKKKLEPYVNNL